MATVKYSLSGRPDNSSIRISLSAGRGNTYKAPTGFYIHRNNWSFGKKVIIQDGIKIHREVDNGHFKNSIEAKQKRIKNDLIKLERYLLDALNDIQSQGKSINGQWLKDQIDICFERKAPSGKSELVKDAIESLIADSDVRKNQKGGNGLSKSRINDYKALKRIWVEFEGAGSIKVKEVNIPLSKKFLGFMINEKKYALGYAKRMIGNLKTVCYDAQLDDIKISPQLKKIDSTQVKNDHIIYLSPEELNSIKNAKLVGDGQRNARKWLLLGCWIGQRGNDLLNLTESNLKEKGDFKYIHLKQQKTSKTVIIPVLPQVQEVLESGWPIKISLTKFNAHLKTIGKIAGLDQPTKGIKNNPDTNRKELGTYPKYELLASHVCRRTYCSNLYGKMPTPIIMQVTGHASERSFLKYIGKKGTDYKDEWMRFIEVEKKKSEKKSKLEIIEEAI